MGQLSYPQSDIEQSQRRDVVTFHRRGVTLVEVGVFSGMLLLLTLMLSVFLANGQTYTRHTNYYSAAHREAALALSDIKGELSRATPTSSPQKPHHRTLPLSLTSTPEESAGNAGSPIFWSLIAPSSSRLKKPL